MDPAVTPLPPAPIAWRNHNGSVPYTEPPLTEEGETAIGVYLISLGWLSWLGNSLVIFVLTRQWSSLQPPDLLTLNLALSDASIAVFGYSRGIIEIFNVFQDDGYIINSTWTCQVDGFLTLLFGLASINTLTVISITRYIKGCRPHQAHEVTRTSMVVSLALVWAASLFWSAAPLLGWGSYTDRRYGTCEIDWMKATFSTIYKSYIISIFICCFFLPISTMMFAYISIINTVKSSHVTARMGDVSERQRNMERDITRVSIVICCAFILAWSPYAVISMYSACGHRVPALTSLLAALFAKSASFYNPFIYFGMSGKFRADVRAMLPCLATSSKAPRDAVRLKRYRTHAAPETASYQAAVAPREQPASRAAAPRPESPAPSAARDRDPELDGREFDPEGRASSLAEAAAAVVESRDSGIACTRGERGGSGGDDVEVGDDVEEEEEVKEEEEAVMVELSPQQRVDGTRWSLAQQDAGSEVACHGPIPTSFLKRSYQQAEPRS
ncbi:opsin-5-like [Lethenteron reissneri]|uniref:opsin-5-like n=1 Tax=Lethenteron reissneri TaxID=7753 RepID=UPI002AB7D5D0|nr:opsin-5-like [Lethenteron reissneri]XP_061415031.1 opsin-5-like [Lethenteron reissneri]